MQSSSASPTEYTRVNLQPLTNPVNFSKLSKECGSKLRLLHNSDKKLQYDFAIVHILLTCKGISEMIEES